MSADTENFCNPSRSPVSAPSVLFPVLVPAIASSSWHGSNPSEIVLVSWLNVGNHDRAPDLTLQLAASFPPIEVSPDAANEPRPPIPFSLVCDGEPSLDP